MARIRDTPAKEILRVYTQKEKETERPLEETVNSLRGIYTKKFIVEKIKEQKK